MSQIPGRAAPGPLWLAAASSAVHSKSRGREQHFLGAGVPQTVSTRLLDGQAHQATCAPVGWPAGVPP